MVCPSKLRGKLFTTAAVDNIDHNTSSTSSHSSFHGTAISLVQHPSKNESGISRAVDKVDPSKTSSSKTISELPSTYSDIAPMALPNNKLQAPAVPQHSLTSLETPSNGDTVYEEKDWLAHAQELVIKQKLDVKDFISWAAFRASKCLPSTYIPAIITLLPMFPETSSSLAMIAHSMRVVKAAVQHLNPSQIPVVALDQPLFALAKQIQWTLPEFDEDHFVIMLGGLHTEMAALKMLGKWLTGSGWSDIICGAGVATQGVAESFLTASHVARTRRAHQVTAVSLHILTNKAYETSKIKVDKNDRPLSLEEWMKAMEKKSPTFLFWTLVQQLELTCLCLVRAFRDENFSLYVDAIRKLLPWMFYDGSHQLFQVVNRALSRHACSVFQAPRSLQALQ